MNLCKLFLFFYSKNYTKTKQLSIGRKKFNMDPKKGIEYLQEHGLLQATPEDVAAYLYKGEGLNKTAIGDYLGEKNPFNEKVLKAFLQRIDEVGSAKQKLESELDSVLKEIAHAEGLYGDLDKVGRQVDFNLKVVQTRLENKRHRPGAENCRDKSQMGLVKNFILPSYIVLLYSSVFFT